MRRIFVLLTTISLAITALSARAEERRVALIIGNDDYKAPLPALDNAANDARAMERALKSVGFDTTLKVNVTRREFHRLIDAFAGKLSSSANAVGLFYYAGHGVQANGSNYLIPTDADLVTDADLEADALDVSRVLRAMDEARSRINIAILDACRDNPLPKSRSAMRGLARMDAPRGTFIGYAAAPGQTAEDGERGGNGVFTGALVRSIGEPGLPIEQMFKKVIAAVSERTGGRQVPWMEESIQGDFYFDPSGKPTSMPPAASALTVNAGAAAHDAGQPQESTNRSDIRARLRADSFKLVAREANVVSPNYYPHMSVNFAIENMSSVDVNIAAVGYSIALGSCGGLVNLSGIPWAPPYGSQSQWLSPGSKTMATAELVKCPPDNFVGVKTTSFALSVMVQSGEKWIELPLNTDSVPVRIMSVSR